ncbi:MAG: CapA family protein [Lachnospiraceae bacterium]|nr:CapA family protein [Lachnospiraceae bacterium]
MQRKLRIISTVAVALLLVVACGKKVTEEKTTQEITDVNATEIEQTTEEITTEKDTVSGEEQTTDSKAEVEAEKPYVPITMAFVGDMYLGDELYGNYTKSGLTGFLSQPILDIFQQTDIMVANHEYCATDLGEEAKDTEQLYNFKAPTAREFLWKDLGVDLVTLANNHTMDYGDQSLLDTLNTLDSVGIPSIGAGKNLSDALAPEIKVVNGKKIAFLAASRFILNYDWYATETTPGIMTTYEGTDRFGMMKDEITRLKEEEKCDIVCVYVHFGKEKTYELTSNQPVIAHGYIDAGADLVIGSHAHNLQGIEIYKDAPIYYNLGNFLFGNYRVDTMVVNVEINEDNSISTRITPCVSQRYLVEEAVGDKAQEIYDFLESISVNVDIDENGNVTEKK